jgi:hypothetical protein
MRTRSITRSGKRFFALALTVGIMLALAFTFNACGSDGGGGLLEYQQML